MPNTKDELGWRWWLWPLRSRKVQVAVATIVGTFAAHYGLDLTTEQAMIVVALGVALILGIAHEDSGAKRNE